ncbi:MAG: ABC transporter ATP-binding protein [Desulfuromonadales bacterium GWD2_61_12]|nr:MAG: ABC transporter ATP-binding protein [Desulfuromonadales bacterium GWC2_61_20]OGR35405.1 MAG: ABC transporter ATP-binding protein [Desulfuromonadales bacterium GWD2_61_12]HAD03665.1 lipoprotein-releasing system ATP-binding protein LolD [Desulfuromonas sp.]HBT83894.1 lipoprotein-releasing system ATP-binding protein LolD [Desulfuromonas sp.]
MTETLIEVRGLTKSFATAGVRVDVLRGLDLAIAQGERVAVVGASGAGKSTLMHILGGLDAPTSGTVHFAGADIFSLRGRPLDAFRNSTIGFVFQFHQLLPEFTALENVMMPALIARQSRHDAATGAGELLAEVGLGHRLHHKPGELSGGEQQRVAIARALIRAPRLLLADEPTGNLDSGTSDDIFALLDRLHQSRGLTMVIVTHSERLAARLDRTIRMRDGQIDS